MPKYHGLKRVGDVRPTFGSDKEYLKFEQLEGQDFVITSFSTLTTQFGMATVIQININGAKGEILTWSQVVLGQLQDVEAELPLLSTVKKVGKYWSLS